MTIVDMLREHQELRRKEGLEQAFLLERAVILVTRRVQNELLESPYDLRAADRLQKELYELVARSGAATRGFSPETVALFGREGSAVAPGAFRVEVKVRLGRLCPKITFY